MNQTNSLRFQCLAVLALVLAALGGCRTRKGTPEQPPDEGCERHLRDIGVAIAEYRRIHGDLPAVVSGPAGTQHSWRALIMPYLTTSDYWENDYRAWEPWDSPHNSETMSDEHMLFYFSCPAERRIGTYPYPFTSYLMLVRPAANGSERGDAARDSLPPDAILIVESANSGIKYAEPRDLHWETLWDGDSPFGKGKLNSLHPNVVKALRVDGRVIDISKNISKERLRELLMGTATNRKGGFGGRFGDSGDGFGRQSPIFSAWISIQRAWLLPRLVIGPW